MPFDPIPWVIKADYVGNVLRYKKNAYGPWHPSLALLQPGAGREAIKHNLYLKKGLQQIEVTHMATCIDEIILLQYECNM